MSLNRLDFLKVLRFASGKESHFYDLNVLETTGHGRVSRLPVSLRIILESLLRHCDGVNVKEEHVRSLANWNPVEPRTSEIPFVVARIVLQDFTGVPLLCDLAAMRSVAQRLGKDVELVEPKVQVDLVVDHSVQVDHYRVANALDLNMQLEYRRNGERYRFIKWGKNAFNNLRVVPPSVGIVHQVNLEFLARGVHQKSGVTYPDTLVGTDSHTTMINALGVVGWGVGGIEAEAGMLGLPIVMLTPDVVGVHLYGQLSEGATATDLVLQITERLRQSNVVGKFVEFFGAGAASLTVPDRATIANMAPEYGATMGYFPVDHETVRYLAATGRTDDEIDAFESYFKAQKLFGMPKFGDIDYSEVIEFDLGAVYRGVAGPKRPQDAIELSELERSFVRQLHRPLLEDGYAKKEEESSKRYPVPATSQHFVDVGHGDVLIAAITSCTNTSNPGVMLAAGLLAKKAVMQGLKVGSKVKTSLAPGSRVVTEYLEKAGLLVYLEELGFQVVAYGCTTCIGNSGPLDPELEQCIYANDLICAAVLSGNRNFEARIHPALKANFLMSPPLVVAFAIAGRVDLDLSKHVLGLGFQGQPITLKDIWPSSEEISTAMDLVADPEIYRKLYGEFVDGNSLWNDIPTDVGKIYEWVPSTYIAEPPFFADFTTSASGLKNIRNARALMILGDSVTTDHISPAGSIPVHSAAGEYLQANGVAVSDFNSYGSRRGNHEVMMRGTFANVRILNLMLPPKPDGSRVEGGFTFHLPDRNILSVYDASMKYKTEQTPTLVFAGKEYGTGSSRDWAAKGARLLGVRAVVAKSFERIHRFNLVGMGLLPLQFREQDDITTLGIVGDETFDILGLEGGLRPHQDVVLSISRSDGTQRDVSLELCVDTEIELQYLEHGGIMPYVLRDLLSKPHQINATTYQLHSN